ncbi:MAG TPA: SWIM zinc finger family protein [Herpetosiphonaceae bacterium]|nr:SWIM zinc finger family protein [Herpetosiphonaceae bacterium]
MDHPTKIALFRQLTWPAIEDWAGAKIAARGQRYQRNHQVADPARTSRGEVVAWVQGTHRYATLIDVDDQGLIAACTCPFDDICKHAVAVVLAYREHLSRQRDLPAVPDTDARLVLLEESTGDDWDEEDREAADSADAPASGSPAQTPLRVFLEAQTAAQLIEMLKDLAERLPDVRAALEARRKLAMGSAEELARDVRRLIVTTSAEPAWRNEWDGDGSIPDYAPVRDRLELLLRQGYPDEVVRLGETLLKAGNEQVEQSHDQGETADEIGACMHVVFRALVQSSLAPSAQILWAIDALLCDDYGLCHGSDIVLNQAHTAEAWSIVADTLAERLQRLPAAAGRADFSHSYARERLSNWAITALQRAGRKDEVIPLAEREAELNGAYVRLVTLLIDAGRLTEAEQWIARGIAALGQTQLGTARQLRDILRNVREQSGDWSRVAAMRTDDFFEQLSMLTLVTLRVAAEHAGVWPAVRTAVMRYLETGEPPQATARVLGDQETPAWPLPETGLPRPTQRWPTQFPKIDLLIEIAADERQPDRVLYWYDRRPAARGGWGDSGVDESLVADAIAGAYPERAMAIWKKLAEAQIAQTQTRAYEVAVGYLRTLGELMARKGRADEWRRYIADLRQTSARKRRLVELLDRLNADGLRGANSDA